uniref:La ribonucleoprotein 4Ab n=1 Tax=Neogobius melanostomus TaxID=47308 RepID=A0A8C6WWV2_9GOBI
MVTTKGASLNPNAQVWQEFPVLQTDVLEVTEDSAWVNSYPPPIDFVEDYPEFPSPEGKDFGLVYPDGSDYGSDYDPIAPEVMGNGCDYPDVGYMVFDSQYNGSVEEEVQPEKTLSDESLRESLKKQLEFYFSRENLSKDLYLISQMDSDQFVSIWTIACMEDIKSLTSDMDLIVDVLKASPLVQVDETGEKVRPNHSRCIIILREVPETTPVEEVEALFKNENCPKALSAEFAHNSNWYITFQSDNDALQALKYLREEVKVFQGKPIMARIKAINTFFGKGGFHGMDSSVFTQPPPPQTPSQPFGSPVYIDMQQVYSPQQQYPVYPVVSPAWSPTPMPYFETPLAPFQNSGYVNGYRNSGHYKGNSLPVNGRPRSRNQGYSRPQEMGSGCPVDVPLSPQAQISGVPIRPSSDALSPTSFSPKDTLQAPLLNGEAGRPRRPNYRGMRRKREDELNTKSLPTGEVKLPPPNFDLAACNFPPLPGSVVTAKEEMALDMRLADVVRGLKPASQPVKEAKSADQSDSSSNKAESEASLTEMPVSTPEVELETSCISESNKGEGEVDSSPSSEDASSPQTSVSEETSITSTTNASQSTSTSTASTNASQSTSTSTASTNASQSTSTASTNASQSFPTTPSTNSEPETRKLSYAEVCQRLAKDPPPPIQPPALSPPSTPACVANQPLQELKVNRGTSRAIILINTTPTNPGTTSINAHSEGLMTRTDRDPRTARDREISANRFLRSEDSSAAARSRTFLLRQNRHFMNYI